MSALVPQVCVDAGAPRRSRLAWPIPLKRAFCSSLSIP